MSKLFSYEPLIIWLRYFYTLNRKYLITNFVMPLIFCIFVGIFKYESLMNFELDIFTISSIFIGFAISILVVLLTTQSKTIDLLKDTKLGKTKFNLHQALIYKFAYIIYVLIFLIFFSIILRIFCIKNAICNLLIIFLLLNSLLTIIEATSNVIFVLMRKE